MSSDGGLRAVVDDAVYGSGRVRDACAMRVLCLIGLCECDDAIEGGEVVLECEASGVLGLAESSS